jgi:hypothetical protein
MREYDGPAMCHELDDQELAKNIGGDLPPLPQTKPLSPPLPQGPLQPVEPLIQPPGAPVFVPNGPAAGVLGGPGGGSSQAAPYANGGPDPCL